MKFNIGDYTISGVFINLITNIESGRYIYQCLYTRYTNGLEPTPGYFGSQNFIDFETRSELLDDETKAGLL